MAGWPGSPGTARRRAVPYPVASRPAAVAGGPRRAGGQEPVMRTELNTVLMSGRSSRRVSGTDM